MTQALGPVEVTFVLPIGGGGAPVPWRYLSANDHTAEFLNAGNAVVLSATFGIDFSISPDGDTPASAGTLTLLKAAPPTATKLVLRRKTAKVQNYAADPGAEGVEAQLDRLTLVAQETEQSPGGSMISSLEALWLGPKNADPTTDNQGNPLLVGAVYFNTVSSAMRVWTGAIWVTVSGAGAQPADPALAALAALVYAANKGIYATGPDAFALYDLTAFGRSFAGAADQVAARAALSLGDVALLNFLTFAFLDPAMVITDTEGLFANKLANALPVAKAVTDAIDSFLIVAHELAAGTNGGTFTSGSWVTKGLTAVKRNTITGASLGANQITLPAGTYLIDAASPAYKVDSHQARLQNITAGTTLLWGSTEYSANADGVMTKSLVRGSFTLAVTSVLEVQHVCQTTHTPGRGQAMNNAGAQEVYTQVKIQRIG